MKLKKIDDKTEISQVSIEEKINAQINTPLRNSNLNNINNNTNFGSNNNLNINYNPNLQNIPQNNEVYFNNMMRLQNIPNYNSPLRSINDNMVINNFPNNNQRNNMNPHQQINMPPTINKNNFLNNPNINMIPNFGNVTQLNNTQNRLNAMNTNINNQQYINYMAIPIIEGGNNTNLSQKNYNYQINNVRTIYVL